MILFFLECSLILCFAYTLKRVYHFSEFCQVYSDFPNLIHAENIFSFLNTFENLVLALFVAVVIVTIFSAISILLSVKVCHPKMSLFKDSSAFNKTSTMHMVEV